MGFDSPPSDIRSVGRSFCIPQSCFTSFYYIKWPFTRQDLPEAQVDGHVLTVNSIPENSYLFFSFFFPLSDKYIESYIASLVVIR